MKKPLVTTLFAALSTLAALSVQAAPSQLPVCLGMTTDSATQTSYCVSTDGKAGENLKTVKLLVTHVSMVNQASETSTSATSLRTGKQKTVGQVTAMLSEVLKKFLAGAAPGTTLGSLGSLEKGGEVDFVAESADTLRFDFKTKDQPVASTKFSKTDATAFAGILAGK